MGLYHHHRLASAFHAGMGWTVQLGSGKPEGCTRLQSDLAVFLQLDALPNANHSVSVVGAFYVPPTQVPNEAGERPRPDGAFYVPPARRPGEAGTATIGWCLLRANSTEASRCGAGYGHVRMVLLCATGTGTTNYKFH
ncbi:Hypothetical predicted protein [Octopus vulgaris]|uniref:Uncharacterized protein n=1 Tax=Octopus vulgaris TaxID=6645 RepID=A0AA36BWZ1_OCTVU|nr:Hypothetical predicted protein [Octopus vulgaris]